MSHYIGGPEDGNPLDEHIAARSARISWICHRPAQSTEYHLYLRGEAGDFHYAGPCDGTNHNHHHEVTCS